MNHLAHCFLSFHDPDLLVGNFIADEVKGRAWTAYQPGVQRGILLHRAIDAFTDAHPLAHQSTARIRPFAGRFAGPVVDILYDYLLAQYWAEFSEEPLAGFIQKTYKVLEARRMEMPDLLRERLPRMLAGDFLTGYTRPEGMLWVLEMFNRRLPVKFDWQQLWDFFQQEQVAFADDFRAFFPELHRHAREFLAPPPGDV